MWFNTRTMTRGKFELSSASSSRNIRTNNRERIYILTVRLSALAVAQKEDKADHRWRSANTGIEGRRRPANSHDGASQKPDTPPTPCKDTRRRRIRKPALPAPMSCRRRDGNNRLFLKQPSLSCFFSFLTPFSHGTLYFLLLIYPSSSSWARTWHAMAGCSQPHWKTGHHPHHSSCQSKTWILLDLYYRRQNDWSIHVKNISIRREI